MSDYSVIYRGDDGQSFAFGPNGSNWFAINMGDGLPVEIGTAQAFGAVGETVQAKSIKGKEVQISGRIYGDVPAVKGNLRRALHPLASGELVFNGLYRMRVHVKESPSVSPHRWNGLFRLRLLAPFPFAETIEEKHLAIGGIEKRYFLPVNFSTPHYFGVKDANRYTDILNDGDVAVAYKMDIRATGSVRNPKITDVETLETMEVRESLELGDYITIWREPDGLLRAEKHSGGNVEDVIGSITDDSTLLEVRAGSNLWLANDELGGGNLSVSVTFRPAVAVLYET